MTQLASLSRRSVLRLIAAGSATALVPAPVGAVQIILWTLLDVPFRLFWADNGFGFGYAITYAVDPNLKGTKDNPKQMEFRSGEHAGESNQLISVYDVQKVVTSSVSTSTSSSTPTSTTVATPTPTPAPKAAPTKRRWSRRPGRRAHIRDRPLPAAPIVIDCPPDGGRSITEGGGPWSTRRCGR